MCLPSLEMSRYRQKYHISTKLPSGRHTKKFNISQQMDGVTLPMKFAADKYLIAKINL